MKSLVQLILIVSIVSAQDITNFQGRRFGGSAFSHSIGYSGLAAVREGIINIKNPSTWVDQKRTILEFNLSSFNRSINSSGSSTSFHSTNFEGLNWVSTIKDSTVSIGFSLKPFHDQNVSILNSLNNYGLDNDINLDADQYITLGGAINEFSLGAGYRLNNKLYLGFSLDYYSGSLSSELKFDQGNTTFVNYNIKETSTNYGLNISISSLYSITDNLSFAATFSPSNELTSEKKQVISIQNEEIIEIKGNSIPFELPQKFSLGFNWSLENSGNLYVEYDLEKWKQSPNDVNKFSFGYQSTASRNVFDSFVERTNFMLGAYYYNDVFNSTNGEKINVIGFTAGTAIPFSFNRNQIFLSAGYAKRGSIDKNNFDESIFTINIGFSIGDFWYQSEIED